MNISTKQIWADSDHISGNKNVDILYSTCSDTSVGFVIKRLAEIFQVWTVSCWVQMLGCAAVKHQKTTLWPVMKGKRKTFSKIRGCETK